MTETGKRRPWYVAPLLAGFGGVLGVAVTLGVISSGGGRVEPKEAHAAVIGSALPPGSISLDERLKNIESTLKVLGEDMAEVKRRLPSKP